MDTFLGNAEMYLNTKVAWVLLGSLAVFFIPKGLWLERNFDLTALAIVLLIFGLLGFFLFDDFSKLVSKAYLNRDTDNAYEIIGIYIFNNPLVVAALIGFPILIKRVSETRSQSRTMQYNAANELLWSERLGSRMAGIEALWRVAHTYPKEEYHNVMDVFSQFVKYPVPYDWEEGTKEENQKAGKRPDISAILQHMSEEIIGLIKQYEIDLRGADLMGADLIRAYLDGADLSGADLTGADLIRAYLDGADLRGANLTGADLSGAHLDGANLRDAHLRLAIVNDVNFTGAKDLTKEQIKMCIFITDHPYHESRPLPPDGIGHKYQEMSIKEWENKSGREFPFDP